MHVYCTEQVGFKLASVKLELESDCMQMVNYTASGILVHHSWQIIQASRLREQWTAVGIYRMSTEHYD